MVNVCNTLCSQTFPLEILAFFLNDTATTETYTLSLHDALPISGERIGALQLPGNATGKALQLGRAFLGIDRKSTRLNSSHRCISYAVFCLKKKTQKYIGWIFAPIAAVGKCLSATSFSLRV